MVTTSLGAGSRFDSGAHATSILVIVPVVHVKQHSITRSISTRLIVVQAQSPMVHCSKLRAEPLTHQQQAKYEETAGWDTETFEPPIDIKELSPYFSARVFIVNCMHQLLCILTQERKDGGILLSCLKIEIGTKLNGMMLMTMEFGIQV